MTITAYHKPACGALPNKLAMIRQGGEYPIIVEHLKDPPIRERLIELLISMGISARDLQRQKGAPDDMLGLADAKWTEDELIDFMFAYLQN